MSIIAFKGESESMVVYNINTLRRLSGLAFICVLFIFLEACMQSSTDDGNEISFPDGSIYRGSLDERGMLGGQGNLIWPTGAYYKGQFLEGLMHGNGVYVLADGTKQEGVFERGVILEGTITDAFGSKYIGKFKNGILNGVGEIQYSNGGYYKGDVANGYENGVGTYTSYNGEIVQGHFKDGVLDGKARVEFSGGGSFEGTFIGGVKQGKGVLIYSDGSRYKGDFNNDKPEGCGVLLKSTGDRYEGAFKAGEFHGIGEYVRGSGTTYSGYFRYGEYVGEEPKEGMEYSQDCKS